MVSFGLKAEKQLRNKNYTEDWALDCHPRDMVTWSLDLRSSLLVFTLYKYITTLS